MQLQILMPNLEVTFLSLIFHRRMTSFFSHFCHLEIFKGVWIFSKIMKLLLVTSSILLKVLFILLKIAQCIGLMLFKGSLVFIESCSRSLIFASLFILFRKNILFPWSKQWHKWKIMCQNDFILMNVWHGYDYISNISTHNI